MNELDQLDMFALEAAHPEPEAKSVAIRYCYDLDNEAFRAHCVRIGVLQFARPGARAWEYLCDVGLSEVDWVDDEALRYAQEHEGKRHRYTDEQMHSHWGCVEIQRRKIQSAWNEFTLTEQRHDNDYRKAH